MPNGDNVPKVQVFGSDAPSKTTVEGRLDLLTYLFNTYSDKLKFGKTLQYV